MDTAISPSTAALPARAPIRRYSARRPYRRTAKLVGALFLAATATFSVGSSLIASYFTRDSTQASTLLAGVSLEVCAALAGAGIGIAMLPLLRRHNVRLARGYFALRLLECLAIISVGAYMLAANRELHSYDLLIYPFTASAGLILSYLLYISRLVPRLLSQLGMLGYLVLLVGLPTALIGFTDLNAGWGMSFLVPGGLFELILPLLLLARGFSVERADLEDAHGQAR
jgi:Domain of unknown function (DUF4386)